VGVWAGCARPNTHFLPQLRKSYDNKKSTGFFLYYGGLNVLF